MLEYSPIVPSLVEKCVVERNGAWRVLSTMGVDDSNRNNLFVRYILIFLYLLVLISVFTGIW